MDSTIREASEELDSVFSSGLYWVLEPDNTVRPCTCWKDMVACCGEGRATKSLADDQVIARDGTVFRVSTVFLALDHNHLPGEPILFETMIFGGQFQEDREYQRRYKTYDEAMRGHEYACAVARGDAIV